jgi:ribonuclease VapC
MVVDSSALIAILLGEPEAEIFARAAATASTRLTSAASYLETMIVMLTRSGPDAREKVNRLINELSLSIVSFTHAQAETAIAAYERYGKRSRHPASLNFGDCFSYALAKLAGEPLLFKGNDFSQTDIPNAITDPAPHA